MISRASEYAIKAMIRIAYSSELGERMGIKEIAKSNGSPEAFTGKILQQLSRNDIVSSIKGPSGGFWMSETQRKTVTIRTIVEIIDSDKIYTKCCLGLDQCSDRKPCPIHSEYSRIRGSLSELHSNTYIDELAKKLDGNASLT
ncbi:MAG: Rrf2 family iron-sulfur cluster assembly transcriptional regulator [Saprospiraceae bacterium]|jgi:Rrf2 family iron-sulfur cluster assembly transcriptional regulator